MEISSKLDSKIEEAEEGMKEGGPGYCPGFGVWILAWLKEREIEGKKGGVGGGKSFEKHSWL